ncbi:RICIN domain-containing protein [Kitasatospora sp. NPDC088346]|uniref:RICIN domain-containing protein n=1 Tax=Kitasatospora sp. NPDC088346 TaxID=3364073 RepID=UPI0037F2DA7D
MTEPMDPETADAELTRRIRLGHPAAAAEILLRHREAVLAHARLYCPDEQDAQHLTSEAFTRTLDAVRSGGGPSAAWRPYLATAVRRTATQWAVGDRGPRLAAGFTAWLASLPGAEEPEWAAVGAEEKSVMVRALRSLPEPWQAALWQALIDGVAEPGAPVGVAASVFEIARRGLGEAYLQVFAQTSDRACRHLAAVLGDAAQGKASHDSLDRHTATCGKCSRARAELTAVYTGEWDVLYAALMLWPAGPLPEAATATVSGSGTFLLSPTAATAGHAVPHDVGDRRRDRKRALALCIAVAVTTAAAIVAAPFAKSDAHRTTPTPTAVAAVPPGVVPAGAAAPTADASPTHTHTPTVGTAPLSTAPVASRGPSPSSRPLGFRLLNTRAGLCAGPRDPAGAFIELQACTGDASQRWERIAAGDDTYQLRNTGTGKCLDGTTGGGNAVKVVQAACLPSSDREVQRWRFRAEADGASFRLLFVPAVPSSDYPVHVLGPQDWTNGHPPGNGTGLAQLPDYYNSPSFTFTADQGP